MHLPHTHRYNVLGFDEKYLKNVNNMRRWLAIDYARLNYSTVSFFNFSKSETAVSRWNRISLNASKV